MTVAATDRARWGNAFVIQGGAKKAAARRSASHAQRIATSKACAIVTENATVTLASVAETAPLQCLVLLAALSMVSANMENVFVNQGTWVQTVRLRLMQKPVQHWLPPKRNLNRRRFAQTSVPTMGFAWRANACANLVTMVLTARVSLLATKTAQMTVAEKKTQRGFAGWGSVSAFQVLQVPTAWKM